MEAAVVGCLRTWLTNRRAIREAITSTEAAALALAIGNADRAAEQLSDSYHRRQLVAALVGSAQLDEAQVVLALAPEPLARLLGCALTDHPVILTAPTRRVRCGKEVKLVVTAGGGSDGRLVALLAEAKRVQAEVLGNPQQTLCRLAKATGRCRHRLSKLFRLAHLSPEIVDAILAGTQPASLSPRKLLATPLPMEWNGQRTTLGFS